MWIIWILLIVVVIWAIKVAVGGKSGTNNASSSADSPSALEILKQRYARGEIDHDEYEQKRKDLID